MLIKEKKKNGIIHVVYVMKVERQIKNYCPIYRQKADSYFSGTLFQTNVTVTKKTFRNSTNRHEYEAKGSSGSSVSIVTRLRPGRLGFNSRQEKWWESLSSPPRPHRPWAPPSQCLSWGFIPEVKRPGREAGHSPPFSADVKNVWGYASTPPYVFMAWCLIKHKENFTFTFTLWRRMNTQRRLV
jgi:hypothetical protein